MLRKRKPLPREKRIFGIGLSGTGTKSLCLALERLGYSTTHYPHSLEEIEAHEAAADISVSCRWRELDQLFPGSKFVLTTRDLESWLSSRARKPDDTYLPSLWVLETRIRTYGATHPTPEQYREAYERHHRDIAEHFRDRPDDLLPMSVVGGDGWEPLCRFLGHEVPAEPFPNVGSTKHRASSSGPGQA